MTSIDHKFAVVAASGGMDSTALLLHLLAEGYCVHAVSFDYGQKHRIELQRLGQNIAYFRETVPLSIEWTQIDLHILGSLLVSALTSADQVVPLGHYEQENMRATFVPNRNAIFASITFGVALSMAAKHSTTVRMALGVHAGDHAIYPDCRAEFYEQLLSAFRLGNWNSESVKLYLPYLKFDKAEILADARKSIEVLGLDFDRVLRNTCTSYLPDAQGRAHGLTGSDVERILAFAKLGLEDPLDYQQTWSDVVARAQQAERNFRSR